MGGAYLTSLFLFGKNDVFFVFLFWTFSLYLSVDIEFIIGCFILEDLYGSPETYCHT